MKVLLERFGERLFANKINPKKGGFQCSLTHIFQHFPTYFRFTPLSYHYILFMFSQLSRVSDFHSLLSLTDFLQCKQCSFVVCKKRPPQNVKVVIPFATIICFLKVDVGI